KKKVEDLDKRLQQAIQLLRTLDQESVDRPKTLTKASRIFRDIEQDFGGAKKTQATDSGSAIADPQTLPNVVHELLLNARNLKPEVLDVGTSEKLANLAASAATLSEQLARAASTKPRP